MKVNLRTSEPEFRRRLKPGLNLWCLAAVLGLTGTWVSGTTVQVAGNFWDHRLNIAVTPATGIITIAWIAVVIWWYRDRAARMSRYKAAIAGNPDIAILDDFGVTWGVKDIATTRIAWPAVAFFAINSKQLRLGLPGGTLTVDVGELDEIGPRELRAFLHAKTVRDAS